MEKYLADKPESMIIRALQVLLPPLLTHWGNPEAFRRAGTPGFMREAGIPKAEAAKAVAVVDQAFRQTARLRNQHFRPFHKETELEYAYTKLVPSTADSPTMQGCLWLAFQVQKNGIEFLDSGPGQSARDRFDHAVDENKGIFQGLGGDSENLTLSTIEKILTTLGRKSLGEDTDPFQLAVLAGYAIELARQEGRTAPGGDMLNASGKGFTEELRLVAPIIEPVHRAELNEANQRFLRLPDAEKSQRFDRLRGYLSRHAESIAAFAPPGFEPFCQAVESQIFPYPTQIEWLRSYLKPLYANAHQSSIFDNCMTEASIRQRYEKVMAEKSANAIMIEMARTFALAKLNKLEEPGERDFLENLDPQREFNWPDSLEELMAGIKA